MGFRVSQKVLFKHCDPAGIVFYPRYFEMMNDCVEAFFEHLGFPFEALHADGAVPTVQIETRFAHPSRHGDELVLDLTCDAPSRTSLGLTIKTRCGEEERMHFRSTIVMVGADGRPVSWPDDLRQALQSFSKKEIQ
ncbi:MAG: thioesterase family protein [Pseudomonadota bacterium]